MYRITDILPAPSGERLILKLECPDESEMAVNISCDAYRRLELAKGELEDKKAASLLNAAEYESAVIKGMSILGYGPNSKRRLCEKLCASGVSVKNARRASEHLARRGYIDEEREAVRLAESLIKRRYGKRRILSDVRSKGYDYEAFQAVEKYLEDVDFVGLCAVAIEKKLKYFPSNSTEMQKAIAKMVSLGYNVNEVKGAFRLLTREE